jgi:thiamine-phosphate pyrophosphorylase
MRKIDGKNLYFIITGEYCRSRGVLDIARAAIDGGVDIIQLREKNDLKNGIAETGGALSALCKKNKVLFIINDDPVLAKKVDADGVHLGQDDLKLFNVNEARKILGGDKIIGLSTGSLEEARIANGEDVDYIGFGPIFPTKIKAGCLGTKEVKKVISVSRRPVFFIGGINISNIEELLAEGARNVAVIRAISEADDVVSAAAKLKEKLSY